MEAVTHLEKVIVGEVSAVTHLEKVIAGETSAVTYTEKVITGEAPPITHLQKVIAREASPVTHLEYVWVGGTPSPTEHEYTGAVPYTFTANGSPLISWRISGNTVQSGTPSSDNPIMPQGTGERTENLYGGTDISGTINNRYYKNDFVYANIAQGTYTLAFDLTTTYPSSEVYTSSIGVGETGYSKDIQQQSGKTDGHFVFTFTIEAEDAGKNLYARFARFGTAVTITYTASNIMLNTGSTALPYEPYGYKILISSANTTTPVYLGEVETTRKIKKLVLDGTENWTYEEAHSRFWINVADFTTLGLRLTPFISNAFGSVSDGRPIADVPNNTIYSGSWGGVDTHKIFIKTTEYTSVADFKSYLAAQYAAGTPVTVWYILATPQTATVNEPLMKIGDYADEVSNVATIPTNSGSNTFDVDTTVKPSEIYIKYKGV